jgi:uncharacterized protein (UPF0276 family)
MVNDRAGIGWRPELAAGILAHGERIDVLEVVADDYLGGSSTALQGLATLCRHFPLHLHSISLGLAGSEAPPQKKIDGLARLVEHIRPELWSEHLAFLRSGEVEIGHLAAPPRTEASVENAVRNIEAARRATGTAPLMENIATLVQPPCSDRSEEAWIGAILGEAGCGLLLDLHNLHANATNFGFDPRAFLRALPIESIGAIHIAGGKWVGSVESRMLVDDHLHPVPDPVYALLEEVASLAMQPLTVILERDGAYPAMDGLLLELDLARKAMAAGRARRRTKTERHAS